jgi:hypothetical protein
MPVSLSTVLLDLPQHFCTVGPGGLLLVVSHLFLGLVLVLGGKEGGVWYKNK